MIERELGDAGCAAREEEMRASRVSRWLGSDANQRFDALGLEPRFLAQLTASGVDRRFPGLQHARGQFQARAAQAMAVLPHQHHFSMLGQAQHGGPMGTPDEVKALDLVAVGQAHPLFADLEPTLRDERVVAEHLPGRDGREISHERWHGVLSHLRCRPQAIFLLKSAPGSTTPALPREPSTCPSCSRPWPWQSEKTRANWSACWVAP